MAMNSFLSFAAMMLMIVAMGPHGNVRAFWFAAAASLLLVGVSLSDGRRKVSDED
jgi:hypothetical protein